MNAIIWTARLTGWVLLAFAILYAITALEYIGYIGIMGMVNASFIHSNILLLASFLGIVLVHCFSRLALRLHRRKEA